MPQSIRVTWALALCLLCACNDLSPRVPQALAAPAGLKPSDAALDAVYADADAALSEGERALAALRNGDNSAAADGLARARASFRAAFSRCAAAPGCATDRILHQQDALLDRQAQALLGPHATSVTAANQDANDTDDQGSPVLRSMPESERSLNLLKGQDLRELIKVNEALRAAMREWLTWMLAKGTGRTGNRRIPKLFTVFLPN